jgi:hypothetical protein
MKDNNEVMKKNAFVKAEQQQMKSMMGDKPSIPSEMKKFNAYMSNDGEKAQESCRKLTSGLDKKAFPVS